MRDNDFLASLRAIPDVTVLDAEPDMAGHLVDWRRRHFGKARAVVFPKSTEAVAHVVRLCADHDVRIFPQGGNTSVCGGSVPDATGEAIVLNLARMSTIRRIDADDDSMIVEAGCILADVQAAATTIDRLFPMSLGAEGSCQIGGNIATNAGGTSVLRYGNMRDLVLGVEVVFPDGSIWNGLRTLRKNNSGYDLKDLIVGSEGTLGIVTAAALRLYPRPRSFATAMLAIGSIDAAVAIGRGLRGQLPGSVSALEIISGSEMDIVLAHIPTVKPAFAVPVPWYLLVELATMDDEADLQGTLVAALSDHLETGAIIDAVVAANERQRAELWALRHNVTEANVKQGMGLTHDIAVPIGRVAEFANRAKAELSGHFPDAYPVVVGHLGDGNLHYIAMFDHDVWAKVDDKPATTSKVNHMLYDIAHEMGGTFSAEHGIGSIHTADMRRYKPATELDAMAKIKSVLDPRGLFNPGRVLP